MQNGTGINNPCKPLKNYCAAAIMAPPVLDLALPVPARRSAPANELTLLSAFFNNLARAGVRMWLIVLERTGTLSTAVHRLVDDVSQTASAAMIHRTIDPASHGKYHGGRGDSAREAQCRHPASTG